MTELVQEKPSDSDEGYHECPKCHHQFPCSFQSAKIEKQPESPETKEKPEIENLKNDWMEDSDDEDFRQSEDSDDFQEITDSPVKDSKLSDPDYAPEIQIMDSLQEKSKQKPDVGLAEDKSKLEADEDLSDFEIDLDNSDHDFDLDSLMENFKKNEDKYISCPIDSCNYRARLAHTLAKHCETIHPEESLRI